MKMRILPVILLILSCLTSVGQNVAFTKNNFPGKEDAFKQALSYFKKGNDYFFFGPDAYEKALDNFLKAFEFNPNNAELNFKIGVCYLYSSYKLKSFDHLTRALSLDPKTDPKLHYFLGRAYHLKMQWETAIQHYTEYKNQQAGTEALLASDVDRKIQECKNGMELMKDTLRFAKLPDSLRYRMQNLGPAINSKYVDYHPVISADEMMLIFTSRRENTLGGGISDDGKYFEDIYVSYKENGEWSDARNLGEPINSSNRNDASCGISVDGQTLYIYRDDLYDGTGNIYQSKKAGHEWQEPKRMPSEINTKLHEYSASLAPDGLTLYFCSQNTLENKGIGTHDIFRVKLVTLDGKTEWSDPENLGAPINTEYGERTVFIHPDGKTLYFSSAGHNSMGGQDIFKSVFDETTRTWSKPINLGYPVNTPDDDIDFVISASGKHAYYAGYRPDSYGEKDIYKIILPADTNVYLTLVKGTVTDESDNPVGSDIEIIDIKTGKIMFTQKGNEATGKFLVSLPSGKNYKMNVSAEGYFPHEETFIIPTGAKYKELDVTVKLKRKEQTIDLEGIVQDENGRPVSNATVEIINNATGEVIAKVKADALGKYATKLKAGKNYGIVISNDGYLFQSVNLDIPPGKDKLKLKPIPLKKIQAGKNIVLNNIFFDFDKASLRPDSKPELERMITILRDNPSMKIEISGHTDNKGSATYNLKLSESRAKSVVDYIVSKGISAERLTYTGYGFLKPIASNATDEGRQQNRRTEFKVLSIDGSEGGSAETRKSDEAQPLVNAIPSSKLSPEIAQADKNNDGRITADEIVAAIDGFFDGSNSYTTEKIHKLIEFFFEQ